MVDTAVEFALSDDLLFDLLNIDRDLIACGLFTGAPTDLCRGGFVLRPIKTVLVLFVLLFEQDAEEVDTFSVACDRRGLACSDTWRRLLVQRLEH